MPRVEDLSVDLDERRGTVDILVRQDRGGFFLADYLGGNTPSPCLCAIATNPWTKGLMAFEEPENGVHPRRLELIADLLTSLACDQRRQVIVTTHSPLFCNAILKKCPEYPDKIAVLSVRRGPSGTEV